MLIYHQRRIFKLILRQSKIVNYFSNKTETPDPKEQKVFDFTSEHIISQDKLSKSDEYQDMAYKFQREWKELSKKKDEEQLKNLMEELEEGQRKKINFLSDAILSLNPIEMRFLLHSIQSRIVKVTNIDVMKLNVDWPSIKQLSDGSWPPNNPNWFLQQEALAKLWPAGQQGMATILSQMGMGGGGNAQNAGGAVNQQNTQQQQQPQKQEQKKETVEKKKEEQQNFDLELSAIDGTQKIKIIKEVRAILALGLKEAKDLVESAPCMIKKAVKKVEADELKGKLEKIGCTIKLI